MANINLSPFKTLSEECPAIKISESFENGNAILRNEFIKGYTCDTELRIKATANVLGSTIFDLLGLAPKSLVTLVARARCPSTMFMTGAQSQPFDKKKTGDIHTLITIPKGMVADTLYIDYSLVLLDADKGSDASSAKVTGDNLWETSVKFLLEGTGSMFPTTTVDFPAQDGGVQAGWKVDWSRTSLHGSPSRVRLLLNGKNAEFISLVNPDNNNEPDQAAIDLLYYGVACSILEYASRNEDDICMNVFEKGTLGEFIQRFFVSHFKNNGQPIGTENVLKRFKDDPEGVRAVLQSNLPIQAFKGK
jgi:hypothetical protein